jgi:hypothetical protein
VRPLRPQNVDVVASDGAREEMFRHRFAVAVAVAVVAVAGVVAVLLCRCKWAGCGPGGLCVAAALLAEYAVVSLLILG